MSREQIFHEALQLSDASERAAYLDKVCAGDEALRARIEKQLAAEAELGSFLRSSAETIAAPSGARASSGAAETTISSPLSERPGALIDRYKLLQQIGEGGFGVVYLAEQREPVKRRVALKIIKLGMDTRQVIARFEAERQALAVMDHPNIAKVLDAGATDTGRPYFVMELVKGIPITDYCDKENVSLRDRLNLFMNVCSAVQHAHQKGIIHRDLKPSNILVTLHDGVPVPKVIDFGIAKATSSELTTKTLFTEHRQMIGTPVYMSPEQAEMSGLDIDTRSDIYSLGVLLYELLTGTTPFDSKELMSKGYAEMMRIIREVEPHKPSTRLSSLSETSTRTAQQRRAVDPKKLSQTLKGDLDWIVMKCLEKNRTRRYETANGLAADIKRHLSDEPVTAGATSTAYKLRKFVKRNRGQVIAGGIVVGALVLATAVSVGFGVSEAQQRKAADAARAEAQMQEAKAKEQEAEARKQTAIAVAVAKFQTDMLAAADPQKLLGDKVTVLQAMEGAVKELDQGSLQDQPLAEARVRDTIGKTLHGLARYADAEPNLQKSLAIHRAALPGGHPDIADSLNSLAVILKVQNKLAEAEPLLREALEIARAVLPAGHPDIANSLNNLARLLEGQNKFAEAETLSREALEIWRAVPPAGHPDIAIGLSNLAALLWAQNKLAEAEPLCREAVEIRRAALPVGHPQIATSLNNLAQILRDQNKLAEAEPLFREAVEIYRAALPVGHPLIANGLGNLASLLQDQNKLAEAEPLCREALQIREKAQPDAWTTFQTKSMLGGALLGQNKLAEAEPLLLDGYRGMKEREAGIPPQRKMRIPEALERLVRLYEAKGNEPEAAAWRSKLEAARVEQAMPATEAGK